MVLRLAAKPSTYRFVSWDTSFWYAVSSLELCPLNYVTPSIYRIKVLEIRMMAHNQITRSKLKNSAGRFTYHMLCEERLNGLSALWKETYYEVHVIYWYHYSIWPLCVRLTFAIYKSLSHTISCYSRRVSIKIYYTECRLWHSHLCLAWSKLRNMVIHKKTNCMRLAWWERGGGCSIPG